MNDKDNGTYIKLFRKIIDWEWYTDLPTCKLFIHILLKASVSGRKFRGQIIPAGSFTTSVAILASETGLSNQQVRTALKKLESTNEITSNVTNKYTQILVIKWGDYQSFIDTSNKQINKQITNKQQSNNNQITTIQECKNDKNINNIYNSTTSNINILVNNYLSKVYDDVKKDNIPNYSKKCTQLSKLLLSLPANELQELDSLDKDKAIEFHKALLAIYDDPNIKNKSGYIRTIIKNPESYLESNSAKHNEQEQIYDDSNNPEFTEEDMAKLLKRRERMKENGSKNSN